MDGIDILQRQQALNLDLPNEVAVVGCGGVGSWTAYLLAMAGVKTIWLFDSDSVSESNLNRIPIDQTWIGKPKSVAVAALIKNIRPDCVTMPVGMFSKKLASQLGLSVTWIISTTDTLKSRQMVQEWASESGVNYIEAAAEGDFGSATGVAADWSTADEVNPGYASVPVWCAPCVSAAVIAVSHVVHNQPMGDRTIRLGWGAAEESQEFQIFDSEVEVVGEPEEIELPDVWRRPENAAQAVVQAADLDEILGDVPF